MLTWCEDHHITRHLLLHMATDQHKPMLGLLGWRQDYRIFSERCARAGLADKRLLIQAQAVKGWRMKVKRV